MTRPLCVRTTSKLSPSKDSFRGVHRMSECPKGFTKFSKDAKNCIYNELFDVPYSQGNPAPTGIMVCLFNED